MNLYSKPSKPFHGCFGRFAGDASELTDFHSPEWTLVRNKKGKENKKISKSSWKVIPKEQVNFVVAPKETSQTYSYHELPSGNKMLRALQNMDL